MRMPRVRFLMVVVIALALGLALLRAGSYPWYRAIYATTLLALLAAIVAARYRPGREGGFWFGFAAFGWGYFLLGMAPWTEWDHGKLPVPTLRANDLLPIDGLILSLADYRAGHLKPLTPPGIESMPASREVINAHFKALVYYNEVSESFRGTGHMLTIWVFGAIGGLLGRFIAGRATSHIEVPHEKSACV